jgi:hypothetical protein
VRPKLVLPPKRRRVHARVGPEAEIGQAFGYFCLPWKHATSKALHRAYIQGMRKVHPDKSQQDTTSDAQHRNGQYQLASHYLEKHHAFAPLGRPTSCIGMKRVDADYESLLHYDGSADHPRGPRGMDESPNDARPLSASLKLPRTPRCPHTSDSPSPMPRCSCYSFLE